jgi:hypothetical protein
VVYGKFTAKTLPDAAGQDAANGGSGPHLTLRSQARELTGRRRCRTCQAPLRTSRARACADVRDSILRSALREPGGSFFVDLDPLQGRASPLETTLGRDRKGPGTPSGRCSQISFRRPSMVRIASSRPTPSRRSSGSRAPNGRGYKRVFHANQQLAMQRFCKARLAILAYPVMSRIVRFSAAFGLSGKVSNPAISRAVLRCWVPIWVPISAQKKAPAILTWAPLSVDAVPLGNRVNPRRPSPRGTPSRGRPRRGHSRSIRRR